jgi:hypothetical protein
VFIEAVTALLPGAGPGMNIDENIVAGMGVTPDLPRGMAPDGHIVAGMAHTVDRHQGQVIVTLSRMITKTIENV